MNMFFLEKIFTVSITVIVIKVVINQLTFWQAQIP